MRHLPRTHYLHVRGKWAANAPARRRVTAAGTLHRAACMGGCGVRINIVKGHKKNSMGKRGLGCTRRRARAADKRLDEEEEWEAVLQEKARRETHEAVRALEGAASPGEAAGQHSAGAKRKREDAVVTTVFGQKAPLNPFAALLAHKKQLKSTPGSCGAGRGGSGILKSTKKKTGAAMAATGDGGGGGGGGRSRGGGHGDGEAAVAKQAGGMQARWRWRRGFCCLGY